MKNINFYCFVFACVGFAGCNKNQKNDSNQVVIEKTMSVRCYVALYEKDTITLQINTLKSGKLTGKMEMKILDLPIKIGTIAGDFRGDTLYANYTFIQGTNDKVVFKNPMAFLKQDNALILGNGKIETYLGATYFAKGVPIDFENVKYKFSTVECAKTK
jgi:hypothetical protein